MQDNTIELAAVRAAPPDALTLELDRIERHHYTPDADKLIDRARQVSADDPVNLAIALATALERVTHLLKAERKNPPPAWANKPETHPTKNASLGRFLLYGSQVWAEYEYEPATPSRVSLDRESFDPGDAESLIFHQVRIGRDWVDAEEVADGHTLDLWRANVREGNT